MSDEQARGLDPPGIPTGSGPRPDLADRKTPPDDDSDPDKSRDLDHSSARERHEGSDDYDGSASDDDDEDDDDNDDDDWGGALASRIVKVPLRAVFLKGPVNLAAAFGPRGPSGGLRLEDVPWRLMWLGRREAVRPPTGSDVPFSLTGREG